MRDEQVAVRPGGGCEWAEWTEVSVEAAGAGREGRESTTASKKAACWQLPGGPHLEDE